MDYSFSEKIMRALGKVITWRIVQTIAQVIIGFIVTGSLLTGLKFAALGLIVNTTCYYLHERAWNKISWARIYDNKLIFNELHRRAIAKSFTWKIVVLLDQWAIAFFVTSNNSQSFTYAVILTTVGSILFWTHERIWNSITTGKVIN
jgi:uncharacterized membrane protein